MQECQEDKSGIKQLVKGSCQDRESISAACPFQGSRQNGAKQERVIVVSKSLAAFVFVMAQKSSKDIPANLFLLFQEENIAWAVPSSHNFRALAVQKVLIVSIFCQLLELKLFLFLKESFDSPPVYRFSHVRHLARCYCWNTHIFLYFFYT